LTKKRIAPYDCAKSSHIETASALSPSTTEVKEKGHCMSEFEQQGRTDHLEAVLQAISVSRQTGILHVERGKGGVRDGGDIKILQGQVIDALSGSRQGAEALEWLLTWGNCQYNFQAKFPNEVISPPATSFPSTPAQSAPITAPLKSPAEPITQSIWQFFSGANAAEKDGSVASVDTDGYVSLPDRFTPVAREARPQENPHFQSDFPAQFSPPEIRAPARVQNGSEALAMLERFRLSRLHRHVFLLLDGKRTAHDLVRLTGRPLNEIERLLIDLERTGLIYQSRH
jgi:hypothetical protein